MDSPLRDMMMCKKCGLEKEESEFHNRIAYKNGIKHIKKYSACKKCAYLYQKDYQKSYNRKYSKLYREKVSARLALIQAVRLGRVSRPEKCQRCGENKKPDGHHNDYSKPFEVEWLCKGCHAEVHKSIRALKQTINS